ncbi:MAG TPA: substrate-binding domain-containing protein [Bacteroidia bacterium]|nr:substrate-binding domain-containing protein [Bacteroidia bacterium]
MSFQKIIFFSSIFLALIFISGCSDKNSPTDTPTSGKINISVDDSYENIIDGEIQVFQALYPYAKINVSYKSEGAAIKDLLDDSSRLVIVNRELYPAEKKYFDNLHLFPKTTEIAEDALAIIVNKDSPDTLMTVDELKKIFLGTDSTWQQISKTSTGKITVVFDHDSSGNTRYIHEKIADGKSFSKNCFSLKSNPQVINYVKNTKGSIGIIGVNWITGNDSTQINFMKEINVVALSSLENPQPNDYRQPFQAYIKLGTYPLCRKVYIISREARWGLGSGFSAFVAGEKGQRIILKSGLVPAIAPTRIVEINTN